MFTVIPPRVEVDDDGSIRSLTHDDTYASADGVIEEATHVFLNGNDLPARMQCSDRLTVAELGFGTGLNFLLTWKRWRELRKEGARLHYVAIEQSPLDRELLARVHDGQPSLASLGQELRRHLPHRIPGFHRVLLDDPSITLTLMYGAAQEVLREMHARVDAWYLDGFAPSKNPEMWSPSVCGQIARLTGPGGTCATYSAAGDVRRALTAAGFSMERVEGHGRKRHMLIGTRDDCVEHSVARAPWFEPPDGLVGSTPSVAVIGAGLAGTAVARSFARRGCAVALFDRGALASGASNQVAGIYQPTISIDDVTRDAFFWAAASLTDREAEALLGGCSSSFGRTGVSHLARDPDRIERLRTIAAGLRSRIPMDVGITWEDPGDGAGVLGTSAASLHVSLGGWLSPADLCKTRASTDGITLRQHAEVTALSFDASHARWSIEVAGDAEGTVSDFDVVVIANSHEATQFEAVSWIPLRRARGQTTWLRPGDVRGSVTTPMSFGHYLIPPVDGRMVLGATHSIEDDGDPSERPDDHRVNLERLEHALPGVLASGIDASRCEGSVGIRCVSVDRLPMFGAVPDRAFFDATHSDLHRGKAAETYPRAEYYPGLAIVTSLGARGIATSTLAAECVASELLGEPHPLPLTLMERTGVGRLLIREYRRNAAGSGD